MIYNLIVNLFIIIKIFYKWLNISIILFIFNNNFIFRFYLNLHFFANIFFLIYLIIFLFCFSIIRWEIVD
jgi:hypothetical protein